MSGRSAAWQRACLGRGPTDSNSSIPYFGFSVFSVIWGICFSLPRNSDLFKLQRLRQFEIPAWQLSI